MNDLKSAALSAGPLPPIAAPQLLTFLLQIGVLLGVAVILGRVAVRFGLPSLVGELLTGVLLGPSILANLAPGLSGELFPSDPVQIHLLDAVGQLGVLLLVGVTGMNIDLGQLRTRGAALAWVSGFGLLIPLGLGIGLGLLLPADLMVGDRRTVTALFLGVALCVSAIPVIAKTLIELRLLDRSVGQLIVASAVVDDVVGWFLLSVVSAMATSGVRSGHLIGLVATLILMLVLLAVLGPALIRAVWGRLERFFDAGSGIAAAVALLILLGAATHALGMEPILGALVGGLLIGATFRRNDRDVATWVAPLRLVVLSVLAPIFFATAGLRIDLGALARPEVLTFSVLIVIVAIIGKFSGVYLGARVSGLGHWEGVALGAGLNARGVIEVIVAMVGLRLGLLSSELYTAIVLVAVVTSVMAPSSLKYAVARMPVLGQDSKPDLGSKPGPDSQDRSRAQ